MASLHVHLYILTVIHRNTPYMVYTRYQKQKLLNSVCHRHVRVSFVIFRRRKAWAIRCLSLNSHLWIVCLPNNSIYRRRIITSSFSGATLFTNYLRSFIFRLKEKKNVLFAIEPSAEKLSATLNNCTVLLSIDFVRTFVFHIIEVIKKKKSKFRHPRKFLTRNWTKCRLWLLLLTHPQTNETHHLRAIRQICTTIGI